MATLPKITPSCTPCTASSAASYRPYPPPELTSTWNQTKFPKRINPLAPPYPQKRINSSWETIPQHWHNEKRRTMMQQKEHERYHSAWSIPFYGKPADKEAYRRHFREVLKQQMADLANRNQSEFKARTQESHLAVEYDRQCKVKDLQELVNKFSYLKRFRDENKVCMEEAWQRARINKAKTDKYEREILRYNPINWSGTLT
ncbi:unnamed protein product [Candidula unifasciata]|uniref:Uncharacterized protein n=1 Tax=Candidula unifasciata TaxID=100452 RepID=A0A8S4A2B9_9EUPU|nr:unnamed protein product [Candidula unifasciata]